MREVRFRRIVLRLLAALVLAELLACAGLAGVGAVWVVLAWGLQSWVAGTVGVLVGGAFSYLLYRFTLAAVRPRFQLSLRTLLIVMLSARIGSVNNRFQFSLGTLLVIVAMVAAFSSIGICTGWSVAVAIVTLVMLGGSVGRLLDGTRWGFMRGATYGLLLSLVALLAVTVSLFISGQFRDNRTQERAHEPAHPRPAEEILKAVQSLVPSARGLPEGTKVEDLLSGHYFQGSDIAGRELYLFADRTYLYLAWPLRRIGDRGTWEYRDGLVSLHTDEAIPQSAGPDNVLSLPLIARVYLPFTARATGLPGDNGKEYVLLLGGEWPQKWFLDTAKPEGGVEVVGHLFGSSYTRVETISANEIGSIKEELYMHCAPVFDRAQWRDKVLKHTMASGVMGVLFVAAVYTAARLKKRGGEEE